MKKLRLEYGYPVEKMSNVFDVSKSDYYAWLRRCPSKRQEGSAKLETVVKAAHERGRGTYGPERLQEELAKVDGVIIGRDKLKRVRRKLGIRCKQVKKFKAITNSKHKLPVADNLLEQMSNSNSISKPYLSWLVFGCSTYCHVRLAVSILAALISSLIWNWNNAA